MKMFMTHDPEVGFEIIKQLLSNQVMSRFICFQRNYRLSFSMTFIITHTHTHSSVGRFEFRFYDTLALKIQFS